MNDLTYSKARINRALKYTRERIDRGFFRWSVTKEEWLFLHDLVLDKKPKSVLEIGSYQYTSTLAIMKAMNQYGGGSLTSIDIEHPEYKFDTADVEWTRLTGKSQDQPLLKTIRGNKYDMIFIDGEHGYYGFTSDLTNSLWLIKDNGTIVFHDSNQKNIREIAIKMLGGKGKIQWYSGPNKNEKGISVYEL